MYMTGCTRPRFDRTAALSSVREPLAAPPTAGAWNADVQHKSYGDSMSSKRQTTMAKLNRERKVKERRELKREKKLAAAAAKLAERERSADSGDPATADRRDPAVEAPDE
jgi:hypothetical protein